MQKNLVLLHGWAAHKGHFDTLRSSLSNANIYVPDLPGHGELKGHDALTIPQLAQWLNEYILEHDIEAPVLFGWSMGALVAFEYIRQYGDAALTGLIIQDMTPKIVNDADWSLGLNGFTQDKVEKSEYAIRSDWPRYAAGIAPRFLAAGSSNESLLDWIKKDTLNNDNDVLASLWASICECDYRDVLPGIRVPVLILAGSKSQLYSQETSLYCVQHLTSGKLVMCENSGHSPHLEEPEKVSSEVNRFIAEL